MWAVSSTRGLACVIACLAVLAGCSWINEEENAARSSSTSASTSTWVPATSRARDVPAGEYVAIPGTRISLRVPEGMQLDPTLPGLRRPDSRTSTLVADQARPPEETPAAILDQMSASFADKAVSAREGFELGEPQRLDIAGQPAVVVTGTQTQQGTAPLGKVLAALITPDAMVTMTGNVEKDDRLSLDQLRAAITEARWSDERAPADLGIDVTAAPGYGEVSSSGTLQFSLGGKTGANVPLFVVAPSLGSTQITGDKQRAYAEQRFKQLPGNPNPDGVTEATVDGLPGWELVGKTTDSAVYAMMLFTPDGYVLSTGFAPKSEPDQMPAFRAMAQSLVVKR